MKTTNPSATFKRLSNCFTSLFAVVLVCCGLLNPTQSQAAILSWSGGGANANWDNDANWGFVGTPTNGDSIIFPASQPNQINTNNIPGLILSQIRFVGAGGGYVIRGLAFTITNNIVATNTTGANSIGNSITLGPPTQVVTVGSNASLTLSGGLSGTNGITKAGLGTLTYGDGPANGYTGPTLVTGGVLQLGKTSSEAIVAGSFTNSTLVISNAIVRELTPFQIGTLAVVTVDGSSALLDLNGFNDAIGNRLTLLHGGQVQTGAGTLSFDNLLPNSILTVSNASGIINGNLNIGTGTCTIQGNADLVINANTAGSANILKVSSTFLYLLGTNTFTGAVTAAAGYLWVNNPFSLGTTNVGTVISNNASLVLTGNFGLTNEALTLNGIGASGYGALDAGNGAGTKTWSGPITLNATSPILTYDGSAVLRINGAIGGAGGLDKTGDGTVRFEGSTTNTYAGTTTVEAGTLLLDKVPLDGAIPHDLVINNSGIVRDLRQNQIHNTSTVTISPTGTLDLSGNAGNNNVLSSPTHSNNSSGNWTLGYAFTPNADLTVTHVRHYFGTRVKFWTDGGSLLATQNVVSVPGTWVETALATPLQLTAGVLYRVAAYTGGTGSNYYWRTDLGTNFAHGTIGEGYEVAGDVFPNNPDGVHCWFVDFRYTVNGGDGIGSLNGGGSVNLGSAYVNSFGTGSHTYDGLISGTGGAFHVSGAGLNYTLNGNNTYSGPTLLFDGSAHSMMVNGSQPKSEIYVGDLSVLGGSGTVGNITANGTIAPGSSPGMLTCSNVLINPSKLFAVEVTGPNAGTDYDQLNIRGTCRITNAALSINLAFSNNTPVAVGQQFRIINNDASDAIAGNFSGYGGGATWTQNGYRVVISYVGGTGNDVVLTLTNVPGEVVGSTVTSGNGDGIIAPNECNYFSVAITNRSATPMTGITATLASKTPGVIVVESPVPYTTIAGNSKGTNAAPFQISTTPNFVCGSNIVLELTVKSASHGAFIVPITLATGAPAVAPVRFDNNTTVNVPDIGTVESTNNVAVWNGGNLTKIGVSLWLSAPLDGDLNLTLFAPDGSSVDLSSGNGGGGLHYGTGSADGSRTTFDDAAGTSITAGTAPFVGFYRPEVALSNLLSTTPVTGNWRLRVQDTGFFGAPDTLRNWSLFLYGTDCGVGSGLCDLCPNVTFSGAFGPSSSTQVGYLQATGLPSVCGVPKPCPGTNADTSVYPAENFTFRNGPSDACISVTLSNVNIGGMAMGAYLGSFNPANPDKCVNYLGDSGAYVGPGNAMSFSFDVVSNAVFVINVLGGGYGEYKLSVAGGDCRPVLNSTDVGSGQAKFDWTTAAAGYQLESTNALPGATVWPAITNSPIVINSRYTVTNPVPPANQFYHLRKPVP